LRTLVCIPTYNEIENIEIVLRRTRAAAPDYDILVLDDNSSDGTAELARAVAEELGQIEVLVRPGKAGLGAAYRAGFLVGRARGYEILCEMDADLSHQPEALPSLVGEVERGADLAIGSRYVPGGAMPNWPAHRLALSRWGNRYVHAALGHPVKDSTAGFRAFRSGILDAIHHGETRGEGYLVQVETAYKVHQVGGRIVEVPITFIDRERGTSKMSSRIVFEAMLAVTWWGLRDRILRRRRAHAA
jgi:dolichol-phosphate mannosyltransferase